MIWIIWTGILVSVNFLSLCKGDTGVSCVFMDSCVLPCVFKSCSEEVVHWFKGPDHVHSFYNNQDQLSLQNQNFRGRTSLFTDQISTGVASLLLRGVKVQDEGRYRCHTSTICGSKDSLISFKVDAPVSTVNISQVENRIICSSKKIYPEPGLTWSTEPPSNQTLQNRTSVHRTEEQLYSISSSLVVSDGEPDLVYSCTIRTRRNTRRTSLRRLTATLSDTETTISCSALKTSPTHLVWRFNHSQIILNQTRTNVTVSEEWRRHVKEGPESSSLTLQGLSSRQEGVYTCEVSDEEETVRTDVFLRMNEENRSKVTVISVAVIVVIVVIVAAGGLILYKKNKTGKCNRICSSGS